MSIAPPPIRLAWALRLGAAALAASATLFTTGCGTTGGAHPVHVHRASAARFTGVHTAQQIAQHFHAATGDTLTITPDAASFDTLSTPSNNQEAYNRYGVFTIYVLHNPADLSIFTSPNGHRMVPDGQGVYWPTAADSSGYWQAVKVYGNVVLSWTAQSRSTNGQFRLLDAILSTLGKGADAVEAKLPPTELSCEARGITPTSTREGTCTENGASVNVVNAADTLQASSFAVQVLADKIGAYIPSSLTFGPPLYAKGAFLGVAVRVANNGNTPLEGLDEVELDVGGRYYSEDDTATVDLASEDSFPVQPGEQGATVIAFDVPPSVAVTALSQGELVVPDDPNSDVQDATSLGAIRLAGASGDSRRGAAPGLTITPA